VAGIIVWLWWGNALAGVSIGASLLLALRVACLFGASIPVALHALKLDPKVAAEPVTRALIDIFTLLFYFCLADWLLRAGAEMPSAPALVRSCFATNAAARRWPSTVSARDIR